MDDRNPSNLKTDEIHAFRKAVDAVIKSAQALQGKAGYGGGGREISLVVTKLQEGKMWAGKVLEEIGSELPEQYRDEAVK